MPISSTPLTIADYAMQSNDPAIQKITLSILDNGSILDDLPLVTNEQLKVEGRRINGGDLPATGWGRVNKAPSEIKTTTSSYEEQVALVREIIQVDRRLLQQKNWIEDPIETQLQGAMAAHCYDMNDAFFHNDPADATNGNPDAWIGLKTRVKNPKLYGLALNSDATTTNLDIAAGATLTTSMTAANANDFLEAIGQAFARLGSSDGKGCVAYTNWLVKERWARAIRILGSGGGFRIDQDAFGRMVEQYRQCKVRDIGFKKDQNSPIISYTLDSSGNENGNPSFSSGTNYSEMYIVRYGPNHFKGWQTNPLKPEYLGRSTETGTYENVLIDWGCGLYYPNSRSFARLTGLRIN